MIQAFNFKSLTHNLLSVLLTFTSSDKQRPVTLYWTSVPVIFDSKWANGFPTIATIFGSGLINRSAAVLPITNASHRMEKEFIAGSQLLQYCGVEHANLFLKTI